VTAHEIAEGNTHQRADTVATDNPHACHRTTAARTVRRQREQRPARQWLSDQIVDDVAVGGIRSRLPQVRSRHEPAQQLGDVQSWDVR
jgi:hypothetical protein